VTFSRPLCTLILAEKSKDIFPNLSTPKIHWKKAGDTSKHEAFRIFFQFFPTFLHVFFPVKLFGCWNQELHQLSMLKFSLEDAGELSSDKNSGLRKNRGWNPTQLYGDFNKTILRIPEAELIRISWFMSAKGWVRCCCSVGVRSFHLKKSARK